LDDYEKLRQPRRRQRELILTRQAREEILLEWGANFHEIIDAIRTNVRVKNQRRRTVSAIGTYDRWEEVMEKAKDKIKRTLLLQKPPPKQHHPVTPTLFHAYLNQQRGPPNAQLPPALSDVPMSPTTLEQPPLLPAPLSPIISMHNARKPMPMKSPPPGNDPNSPSTGEAKESSDTQDGNTNNQEDKNPVLLTPPIVLPFPPTLDEVEFNGVGQVRPAPLIGINVWAENQSVTSDFKGTISDDYYTEEDLMSINTKEFLERAESEDYYPSSHRQEMHNYGGINYNNPVELDDLRRDHSCWELTGVDGPTIRRKVTPVIIYEDSSLPDEDERHVMHQFSEEDSPFAVVHPFPGEEGHLVHAYPLDNQANLQRLYEFQQYQQHLQQLGPEPYQQRGPGCLMQPPPHSNSLISNWQ
jgi:hypothetical protein